MGGPINVDDEMTQAGVPHFIRHEVYMHMHEMVHCLRQRLAVLHATPGVHDGTTQAVHLPPSAGVELQLSTCWLHLFKY